jgi:flavin-dependent dehydrogenase
MAAPGPLSRSEMTEDLPVDEPNRRGEPVDVLVLGGGPAGLSASIGLARSGLRTMLATPTRVQGNHVGESLSSSARPLLVDLGVWDAFEADGHAPCLGNASAWGSSALSYHDFLGDPRGHAWHIDRPLFERRLAERASLVGVRIVDIPRVPRVERIGDRWRVGISEGNDANEVGFLVDATGRSSWLGRRRGALRVAADRQVAAVAFLESRGTPIADTMTLVEAVERGWWYSAPLPDGRLVVAFMTDTDLLPPRSEDPETWLSWLDEAPHTSRRLDHGDYRPVSSPRVVAASSGRMEPTTGPGWAAVGDAAICFDPLSSHGLTVALASGRDLAEALSAHFRGEVGAIDRYTARLGVVFARYAAMRFDHYRDERRWPDALYWRRRHRSETIDFQLQNYDNNKNINR